MKRSILIILILVWSIKGMAQLSPGFLLPHIIEAEQNILHSRGLRLIFPEGFEKGYFDTECFEDSPFLWRLVKCMNNKIISKDGNSMSFIPIFDFFPGPGPDSIVARNYFENWEYRIEHFHINQIKAYIRVAYGDSAAEHWKDYVTYYGPEKTKEIFNADTAITFDVKLLPEQYFMGKYVLVRFLVIQKKRRFFNMVITFYTDQALNDRERYDMLNNSILKYIN
ncbi:hypothetical protein [Sphingobacterium cellulitidis]|nr:hypothetical protein [Sphingobacterium soli]MBA8988761.1 hypothetical protein [Sphingobacterium soli]